MSRDTPGEVDKTLDPSLSCLSPTGSLYDVLDRDTIRLRGRDRGGCGGVRRDGDGWIDVGASSPTAAAAFVPWLSELSSIFRIEDGGDGNGLFKFDDCPVSTDTAAARIGDRGLEMDGPCASMASAVEALMGFPCR